MKQVVCRTDASIKMKNGTPVIGLGGAIFKSANQMRESFMVKLPHFLAHRIGGHIEFAESLAIYEMINFCVINGYRDIKIRELYTSLPDFSQAASNSFSVNLRPKVPFTGETT